MKKKWYLSLFLTVILVFVSFYAVCYFKYSNKTFILCYHKIDYHKTGLKGICVRPEVFDRQMEHLHRKGYRSMSLRKLINLINNNEKIPKKSFVLTFDDGYEDNYTSAFSILKKYNFTATIFLIAGCIPLRAQVDRQDIKVPPYISVGRAEKYLNPGQIKEMLPYVDFEAHSISHPHLTQISLEGANAEIAESKKMIEKIIDKPVDLFCYPFGDYNDEIRELVKQNNYIGAVTTKAGLVGSNADVYLLPRIEFKEIKAMSLKDFFIKIDFYIKTFFGL